jgi:Glycosyltransferase family 87
VNDAGDESSVAGPSRRSPLVGIRPFWAILLLQLGLAYLAIGFFFTLLPNDGLNRAGNIVGVDFAQYYAASGLALGGDAAGVYDHETLFQAERALLQADPGRWPWSYPPTALLLVLPLALLPYLPALYLWLALGLAALLLVAWLATRHPLGPVVALLYPAVASSLFAGQNGCLSAALLGGGLLALERRPWLAGLLFGLLSYKPQLGLLLPVALLAGGHWRAFAGAAAATLGFAAVSLAAFGTAPWSAFFANLGFVAEVIERQGAALENMPTWFALVALPGGSPRLAYAVQVAGVLAALAFVAWLWRRPARPEVKAAGLLLALPMSTPYAQFYDLAALALALLWFGIAAREHGWRAWERPALALLWLAPVALWVLALWLKLQLWPLLLLAVLVLVARRARTA